MVQRLLKEHRKGHWMWSALWQVFRAGLVAFVVAVTLSLLPSRFWLTVLAPHSNADAQAAIGWLARIELFIIAWTLMFAVINHSNVNWSRRIGEARMNASDPILRSTALGLRGARHLFRLLSITAALTGVLVFVHLLDTQVASERSTVDIIGHSPDVFPESVAKTKGATIQQQSTVSPRRGVDGWSYLVVFLVVAALQMGLPPWSKSLAFYLINWTVCVLLIVVLMHIAKYFVSASQIVINGSLQVQWLLGLALLSGVATQTITPLLINKWGLLLGVQCALAGVNKRPQDVLRIAEQAHRLNVESQLTNYMRVFAHLLLGHFAEASRSVISLEQMIPIEVDTDTAATNVQIKQRVNSALALLMLDQPFEEHLALLDTNSGTVIQAKLLRSYLCLLCGQREKSAAAFRSAMKQHPLLTGNFIAEIRHGRFPLWLIPCGSDLEQILKRPDVFEQARPHFEQRSQLTPARQGFFLKMIDSDTSTSPAIIRRWHFNMPEMGSVGPVSERDLRLSISSGRLTRSGTVSRDGKNWKPAATLTSITWPGQFSQAKWRNSVDGSLQRGISISGAPAQPLWKSLWAILRDLTDIRRGRINALVTTYLRVRRKGMAHADALRAAAATRAATSHSGTLSEVAALQYGKEKAIANRSGELRWQDILNQFESLVESDGEVEQLITLIYVIDSIESEELIDYDEFAEIVRTAIDLHNGAHHKVELTFEAVVARTEDWSSEA